MPLGPVYVGVLLEVVHQQRDPRAPQLHQVAVDVRGEVLQEPK